jgi:multiple sugar transport system ATP-binding protein
MGRAIVREPQAFLMDEPLSNLDAKLRVEMRAEILAIQRSLAVTTIYVTHDQTEAMTMGDRVVVMRRGVLQQVDAPQRLYERPVNLFVAEFIGSPAMNLVEADLGHDGDGLVARFGEHALRLGSAAAAAAAGRAGSRIILGFRPEDAEDGALSDEARPGARLAVVPAIREDMGAEVLVHFGLGVPAVQRPDVIEGKAPVDATQVGIGARSSIPFVARLARETRAKEGEPLELTINVDRLYLFDLESGEALYA